MPLSSDKHIVDQKFKSALENSRVRPSNRVWYRLSHSLSNKKSAALGRRIIITIAALLLLISSSGLYQTLMQTKPASENNTTPKERIVAAEKHSIIQEQSLTEFSKLNVIGNKSAISNQLKKTTEAETQIESVSLKNYPAAVSQKESIEMLPLTASNFRNINDAAILEKETHPINQQHIVEPVAKSYYVGIVASLSNTWLIDKQALKSDNLKYEPTFGGAFGIQAGYTFSKRWGIQTAWILNSHQGQHYKNLDLYGRTTDLDYNQKSISLNYMQLPVLVQYKISMFSEMLKTPVCLNLTAGAQYGHLTAFSIDDAKGELQSDKLFRESELAAVAGIEYDFRVDRPVFYSLGLSASYGTNIFKPGVPNYFEFNEPHNFLIGIRGSVNFGFSK